NWKASGITIPFPGASKHVVEFEQRLVSLTTNSAVRTLILAIPALQSGGFPGTLFSICVSSSCGFVPDIFFSRREQAQCVPRYKRNPVHGFNRDQCLWL